jgi:hypothetical protein
VWALADLLGVGQASTGGMYEFWTGGGRDSAVRTRRGSVEGIEGEVT